MTPPADDVDLVIVTMVLDAAEPDQLAAVLARYVVVSRGEPGCRNIDLCHSATKPGRFLVVEKWDSAEAQRAHFDSPAMVDMARSCEGLLARPADIDMFRAASAHDLR